MALVAAFALAIWAVSEYALVTSAAIALAFPIFLAWMTARFVNAQEPGCEAQRDPSAGLVVVFGLIYCGIAWPIVLLFVGAWLCRNV